MALRCPPLYIDGKLRPTHWQPPLYVDGKLRPTHWQPPLYVDGKLRPTHWQPPLTIDRKLNLGVILKRAFITQDRSQASKWKGER